MRKLFAIILVIGLLFLAIGIYVTPKTAESIEGYFRQILKTDLAFLLCLWGVALMLFGLTGIIFRKTAEEKCSIKSVGIDVGIGAGTGLLLYCFIAYLSCFFLTDPKNHPITYPMSVIVGLLSFIFILVLLCVYTNYRKEKPSVKGVILDVFLGLCIPLPICFLVGYVHVYMSDILYNYYLSH